MLFQISGIKQIEEKQENMSFLIEAQDEASAREFCAKNSIVLFELKPYLGQKEAFGKVPLKVPFGNNIYDIITPFEKARDAYIFYTKAGLQITYINNYTHWMTDEDVDMVLKKLQSEYTETKSQIRKPREHNANIANVVLQKDPELEKMKHIASQAIADMEEIQTKNIAEAGGRQIQKLRELEDELKKTRMGSNIAKMRNLVSDSYKLMEQFEMNMLDQQKAEETSLIENSMVTHLDFVREYEKYEKAQKVKRGKLEKTPSDIYYIFFGKTGMYQKFLGKDFEGKFSNWGEVLYKSIDYMVMFILMCLVWLTIVSVYQHYILQKDVFFFAFVDFALIGLILILINKFKKHHTAQILVLFAIGAAVYFVARYLLISNFAL